MTPIDTGRIAILGVLVVAIHPATALADDWSYSASLYGWVPAISAGIDTPFGPAEADISQSQVLDNLDFALMGTFSAQKGRLSLIGDIFYSDLSGSKETPFGLFSRADTSVQLTMISGYAMVETYTNGSSRLDLGAGFRYVDLAQTITLQPGIAPGLSRNIDDSWIDPVLALRFRTDLTDRWYATAFADFGGFGVGSETTWQALALVGYRFSDTVAMQLGYRVIDFDRVSGGADYDLNLSGPFLGVTWQF